MITILFALFLNSATARGKILDQLCAPSANSETHTLVWGRDDNFSTIQLKKQRTVIGSFSFRMEGSTLFVGLTFVKPIFRRQGYSEIMLDEVLNKYPHIQKISGRLRETNLDKFLENRLKKRMSLEDAVRETPSLKRYTKLGFTHLEYFRVEEEENEMYVQVVVTRSSE